MKEVIKQTGSPVGIKNIKLGTTESSAAEKTSGSGVPPPRRPRSGGTDNFIHILGVLKDD